MDRSHIRLIQIALLVLGVSGWVYLGSNLKEGGKLEHRPNVLHLKGSPFGRTLALAMRGPVDVYWHRGAVHSHEGGDDHSHDEPTDHGHGGDSGDHGHHHHDDGSTDPTVIAAKIAELKDKAAHQHEADEADAAATKDFEGVRPFLLDQIDAMRSAYYSRTNTRTESALHKAFIMGETQRRLAISYHMDPTNNACYGAYFMFLSEAIARVEGVKGEDGVIRVRQRAALDLANYTIQYCLKYDDEAPAMITAANAAHDYLQIYLAEPEPDLKVAAQFLRVLDGSLQQYASLRAKLITDGTWERFSVHRRNEMENAYSLVRALREADHEIFGRLNSTAAVTP